MNEPIRMAVLSPDGQWLALATMRGGIQIRQTSGGKVRTLREANGAIVSGLIFKPDEATLVSLGDGQKMTTSLWSVMDGSLLGCFEPSIPISGGAFSPDGTHLALGGRNGTVQIWKGLQQYLWMPIGTEAILSLAYSPDGSRLAMASGKVIHLWDVQSGMPLKSLNHGCVNRMAFSPDGTVLATGSSENNALGLWSRDGDLRAVITGKNGTQYVGWGLQFTPDSHLISYGGHRIWMWSSQDGSLLKMIEEEETILSMVFRSDGVMMALRAANDVQIISRKELVNA